MHRRFTALVAVFTALVFTFLPQAEVHAQAQCASWVSTSSAALPPARLRGAFAYLPALKKGVLFGGTTVVNGSITVLGDTWFWDSTTRSWQGPLNLATNPPARFGAGFAYDEQNGVLVMFGGANASGQLFGDTWLFDGTSWKQVSPASAPSARVFHSMVYSQSLGQVILAAGLSGNTLVEDTWAWDGSTWTRLAAGGLGPRELASLSSDDVRGRLVLFGGFRSTGYLGDTLEFNGTAWQPLTPAVSPVARVEAPMVFHPVLQQSVLFGGVTQEGQQLNDTWLWNGVIWSPLTLAGGPSPRRGSMALYDPNLTSIVVFGGNNDPSSTLFNDTFLLSVPDADGDLIADCIDPNPAVPNIASMLPTPPVLRIVGTSSRPRIRVQMQTLNANVSYLVTYYEVKKVKRGRKARIKLLRVTSRKPVVDLRKVSKNKRYAVSYQLRDNTAPAIQSQQSRAKQITVKLPKKARRR